MYRRICESNKIGYIYYPLKVSLVEIVVLGPCRYYKHEKQRDKHSFFL